MKTSIYTTVSALALMIGMPAVAQTLPTANYPAEPAECATAGNNCSTIDQLGETAIATVTQSGSGNVSDINQTAQSKDVSATVRQTGTNAESFVEQSGTSTFVPNANGTLVRNQVDVTQSGDGARSAVYQGGTARLAAQVVQNGNSDSFISQEGNNTSAEVSQTGGDGNNSVIFQSTNTSTVGIALNGPAQTGVVQNGSDNQSEIYQGDPTSASIDERDLTASVRQTGNGNESFVIQTNAGGRAEATAGVIQTGNDNKSSIDQSGVLGNNFPNGTWVDVRQTGNDNMSDVKQDNQATNTNVGVLPSQAFVTQNGDKNDSTVDQSSFSAQARVTQTSEGINPTSPRARANRFDGGTDTVRGNFSNVEQSGNGENSATLTQAGQLNRSDIRQSNASGDATATVVQDGIFNNSDIRQTAASEATVNQRGDYGDNDSLVEQSADNAKATVNQFGNLTTTGADFPTNQSIITQASAAEAEVTQTGSQNVSTITQDADASGALAVVKQETAPASIGAFDEDNTSTITQSADTSAFVEQIGQKNFSNVEQASANLTPGNSLTYAVEVRQLGQDGSSNVFQTLGDDNEASVTQQEGSLRATSTITQNSADNFAVVDQSGSDNSSTITQGTVGGLGDGNFADVTQEGSFNVSFVTQSGNDNSATVSQGSNNNLSTITQSGNGNSASVMQNAPVAPPPVN